MTAPAAIALWTGGAPRFDLFRIDKVLELGRTLVGDDRMSSRHARLERSDGGLVVTDLGSQNGTFIAANRLGGEARPHLPTLLRTARTLFLVVADAAQYEGVTLARRHGLVVGASLRAACRALDEAVLAEDCVVITGTASVARKLAASYAAQRGGACVRFDGAVPLADAIAQTPMPLRTIVLDGLLDDADRATLATWLETDVRVATVLETVDSVAKLPPVVALRSVTVPHPRLDELAATLSDLAAGFALHVSAVEALLLDAWRTTEDAALDRARASLAAAQAKGRSELRAEDLFAAPIAKHALHPWSR